MSGNTQLSSQASFTWRFVWYASLLAIPLFSIYGRDLQGLTLNTVGRDSATLIVSLLLMLLIAGFFYWLKQRARLEWVLIGVILLVYFLFPLGFERFEERMHFLLFGILGFSTRQLYPFYTSLFITYCISGLDELLQWWLPDRVGDWRDVFFNMLAGFIAVWITHRGHRA